MLDKSSPEFQAFREFAKRLVVVPKHEVDAKIAERNAQRERPKKNRKKKPT